MILVILSTVPHPFPRAVRLARDLQQLLGDPDLRVQHGHTAPIEDIDANWRQWYSRQELATAMRECTTLVVHGGSGCIFEALRHHVTPVAVPRLVRFREHVDDHQLQLCSKLDEAGMLVSWQDGASARIVRDRLVGFSRSSLPERPDLRPAVWAAARALAAGTA